MGLIKREYIDHETVVTAENMNAIQDAVIALEDGLFSVENDKSGAVITITDASKRGLKGLNIYGKTAQNGTPTPDAPVDLVSCGNSGKIGVSIKGKNLLDLGKATFVSCINNGGVLVSNVTNSHYAYLLCPDLASTFMACRGNTVTFSANKCVEGRAMAVVIYGKRKNGEQLQSLNGKVGERFVSIQIADDFENITSVELRWNRSLSGVFTDTTSSITDLQVEIGAVATTYEPYIGQTMTIATPNGLPGIPVASGGNHTDANGQQWICDEIDFARGVYLQRCMKLSANQLTSASYVEFTNCARVGCALTLKSVNYANGLSTHLPKVSNYTIDTPHFYVENGALWVFAPIAELTERSKEGVLAWAKTLGIEFVYALETPIETRLTENELAAYAALHTYKDHTTVSNDAGAWMDLEYVMDAKKYLNSLAFAGGASARLSSVTLSASKWTGSTSPYAQVVTIDGITEYSKVDLLPSVEQLAIFHNKDLAFVTENDNGVVTVYAIGDKPTNDYTMQVQITEVVV